MIKVELCYNPYIQETVVKFNGKKPGENSLIEKYQYTKLFLWIDKMPTIFHDEMNGFDFELEFNGTVSDFDVVKKAFAEKGVKDNQVKFFLKNELENASEKCERLDKLVLKLMEEANDRIDINRVMEEYKEIFYSPYPYIIYNGKDLNTKIIEWPISVETIENEHELDNTNLNDMPILICIDDFYKFRFIVEYLVERDDVYNNQIFFLLTPGINKKQISRVINDLGIVNPQFVKGINDKVIMDYIENFPKTDYVKNALIILKNTFLQILKSLNDENDANIKKNKSIYEKIAEDEENIKKLRSTDNVIVQKDNIEKPDFLYEIKEEFKENVFNWRKKKTKIYKEDEAKAYAFEFDSEVKKAYSLFKQKLENGVNSEIDKITKNIKKIYEEAGIDVDFAPELAYMGFKNDFKPPILSDIFLQLKEEKEVQVITDIWGALFSAGTKKETEYVIETTYSCEEWRKKAFGIYEIEIDRIFDDFFESMVKYNDELYAIYHEHIIKLIDGISKKKEDTASILSDEEKKIQKEFDWIHKIEDELELIERG